MREEKKKRKGEKKIWAGLKRVERKGRGRKGKLGWAESGREGKKGFAFLKRRQASSI